jgi:ligand-binding sensor domain-containing protein/signal transduction histidine kinase
MPLREHALWMVAWLALGITPFRSPAAPDPTGYRESYSIDLWENDDGLPQNAVIAVTQTHDGYLWLGTLNGLVRFDGTRFTVFDENNTPGLPGNRIVHLFEDSHRSLWIGTETTGAALARNGQIIPLDIGRGSREGRLVATCEDTHGAVWLYTADGQLCRHRDGHFDVWNVGNDRFSRTRILAADAEGIVWVGMDWSLIAIGPTHNLDPTELPFEKVVPFEKLDLVLTARDGAQWRLGDGRIRKWRHDEIERDLGAYPWNDALITGACEDADGRLVVGTHGAGVFLFDPEGVVTQVSTELGLSHSLVLSLAIDREGSLWVGTNGRGLNRVRRQSFTLLEPSQGLVVRSVTGDAQGGLWAGYSGGGLNRWLQGQSHRFLPDPSLPSLPIRALLVDSRGRLWTGTEGAGLFLFENDRFERVGRSLATHPVILALHEDRRGQLWAGTQGGLARFDDPAWRVFTTADGLSGNSIRAIADDARGRLWVGTERHGLNRFEQGRFTPLRRSPDGLPSDAISALFVDAQDVLWVGTDGGGLARLEGDRWTRYTTDHGLASNSIGYLLEDSDQHLWLGSNAGLMRIPISSLNNFARGLAHSIACRTYGRPEGLPTRECTLGSQPAAYRDPNGQLWFSTIQGLASTHPSRLQSNPHPPPVHIESVLVENQPQETNRFRVTWPDVLVIPPRRERLEIHFTSLNLAAPDRARFRTWLEGHETSWTEPANIRAARYSRLPPGEYRFHVTACNEDGVWNDAGATLAFVVQPPFWRTWWFLSLSAGTLLTLLVLSVHTVSTQRLHRQLERFRHQQALEKERARIARDLHDQLGASLTQIALLGEMAEVDKDLPEEVESHSRQICQTSRETTRVLDEIVWAVNPSNDSLDGLITYFCKYAQEFFSVANVRYRQEVPPHLPTTSLPPDVRHNVFLAAKEAVTNIVRHAHATEARVRLHLHPATFTLEIEDNGRGFAPSPNPARPARNGLRNMRRRLEELGGQCVIQPAPGGGTRVAFTAPLTTGAFTTPRP